MKILYEIYQSSGDGFTNSRTALKRLLNEQGHDVIDLKLDLELNNFRELPHYPDFYTSLSHTKELGAAAMAKRSDVRGIGIDIEWADRAIKPGAEKFFVNPLDQHELVPIELWTAKEAAFKALSPIGTFPGTLVLSKIIVQGNHFYTAEVPDLIGEFRVYQQVLNDKKFVFTIASI